MKSFTVILPFVRYKGFPITLAFRNGLLVVASGVFNMGFQPNKIRLFYIVTTICLCLGLWTAQSLWLRTTHRPDKQQSVPISEAPQDTPPTFTEVEFPVATKESTSDYRQEFIIKKQKLIYDYTTKNGVSRLDQLSDQVLLEVNQKISRTFREIVLSKVAPPAHVWAYFTDTSDMHKLETSLMEQAKYNVPASIKLAQSALETGYGKRVIHNNYFGIKDKSRSSSKTTTTEFYNEKEFKKNRYLVVRYRKVTVNGRSMYKCTIRDHFKNYRSPWQSFRDHSLYLSSNKRYAPLFTGGKKFEAWADKIGSSKDGGVGYATSPVYGEQLKSIIKRYHLDLLDH